MEGQRGAGPGPPWITGKGRTRMLRDKTNPRPIALLGIGLLIVLLGEVGAPPAASRAQTEPPAGGEFRVDTAAGGRIAALVASGRYVAWSVVRGQRVPPP